MRDRFRKSVVPWVLVILLGVASFPFVSMHLEGFALALRDSIPGLSPASLAKLSPQTVLILLTIAGVLAAGVVAANLKLRQSRVYGVFVLACSALAAWGVALSLSSGATIENMAGLAAAVIGSVEGYGSFSRRP